MMSRFLYMACQCCDHPEPCAASDLEDVLGAYVLRKPVTHLYFLDISIALFFPMVSKLSNYFFVAYSKPEQTERGYIEVELYLPIQNSGKSSSFETSMRTCTSLTFGQSLSFFF